VKGIIEEIGASFDSKDSKSIYSCLIKLFEVNQNLIFQKHPLGFKFCNIGQISNNQDLRIHIWDNDLNITQDEELQIHNHSFDFESFIVSGRIKNTVFKLKNGINLNGHLYEVKFVDNKSFLEEQAGSFDIEITLDEEFNEGSFYFLNRNEFHQSKCTTNFSITLIRMIKPSVFKSPMLYSTKSVKQHLTYSRSPISSQENREIINQILKLCKGHL
jgi:quercetin dioxygenase-like cupin family protein